MAPPLPVQKGIMMSGACAIDAIFQGDSKRLADILTAFGTIVAAIMVVVEYLRKQREKKSDRAAELESALQKDPLLLLATTILDWGAGALPLPDDLRSFTGDNSLVQDLDLLFKALRPALLPGILESRKGTTYRIVFVALFNYIQRAVQLWKRGYVLKEDIALTRDLAKQLVKWGYADLGKQPAELWFIPAMNAWYQDVHGGQSLDELVSDLAN